MSKDEKSSLENQIKEDSLVNTYLLIGVAIIVFLFMLLWSLNPAVKEPLNAQVEEKVITNKYLVQLISYANKDKAKSFVKSWNLTKDKLIIKKNGRFFAVSIAVPTKESAYNLKKLVMEKGGIKALVVKLNIK